MKMIGGEISKNTVRLYSFHKTLFYPYRATDNNKTYNILS